MRSSKGATGTTISSAISRRTGEMRRPIAPLAHVTHGQHFMRRFDFDPEAVVRLCWAGVAPINLDAPVRYFRNEDGGVSHFNYLRDNALLTWMHARLLLGFLLRLPRLIVRKLTDYALGFYAARDYIARAGAPQSEAELAALVANLVADGDERAQSGGRKVVHVGEADE